ncbi:putative endonuclease [Alteromonadaceae bacterium 2753L.S.0a.02]|nr:putative endonuclease [Alteromonadaceae bacterium 2753L.S.0a.02]
MNSQWYVYMVRCADDSLYTGVTTEPQRREVEHNSDKQAARYTRARQPVRLVFCEPAQSRSAACRREAQIKALSRSAKLALIRAATNCL